MRRLHRRSTRSRPQGRSPQQFVTFAILAVALSGSAMVAALLGLDLSLHKRFEKAAGLNYRGYRGPVVTRKHPGERRIVVLGGSTAFGYGLGPDAAIPAYLQRKLNERQREDGRDLVSVVNLAYNSEGAYSFIHTLRDYDYLQYDVALLYSGYNDLEEHNTRVFRHESPIFRLTGYYPIFPLVVREKLMALRYNGNLEAAYRDRKTVFNPKLAEERSAQALVEMARVRRALATQLAQAPAGTPSINATGSDLPCPEPWGFYCQAIAVTVDSAFHRGKGVVVVTQPYVSDAHKEQQRAMRAMLESRFGDHPQLRYVNLGDGVINLQDSDLCYDGVHLAAEGNERIAEHLVVPVLHLLGVLRPGVTTPNEG